MQTNITPSFGTSSHDAHPADAAVPFETKPGKPRQISSCVNCRSRKVKCDRQRPACSRCIKHNQTCSYFDGRKLNRPGTRVPVEVRIVPPQSFQDQSIPPPLGILQQPQHPGLGPTPTQAPLSSPVFIPGLGQLGPGLGGALPGTGLGPGPVPVQGQVPMGGQVQSSGQGISPGIGLLSPGVGLSPGVPGVGLSPGLGLSPGISPSTPGAPPHLLPSSTPGRLVKDENGLLHYSQSFFTSVLQSATPVKSMEGQCSGVPFFCKPGADPSIPPYQIPIPKNVITTLLTTYIRDIHSVIRIVDLVQLYKDLNDYFDDPSTATPGKMAMLYAMLHFASDVLIKMGADEKANKKMSPQDTSAWIQWKKNLYDAATNTLTHSEYVSKPTFHALRAHILLLYCSVGETLVRGTGLVELPILIRLAQSIGLHRDASNYPGMFTFAECEMRRRTWFYLQHLDSFYSRSFGLEPMIHDRMFDTRLPLLLDDQDLHQGHYKHLYDTGNLHGTSHVIYDGIYWPTLPDKMDWNDMCQSAIYTSTPVIFRRLYERMVGCQVRDLQLDLELVDHVRRFHERIFEITSHCDSRNRRAAFYMSRLANSRCLIYLYTPYLNRKGGEIDALREHIFNTSLLSLEYALEMSLSPYYVSQRWFSRKFTQVEHLLFLLTKLKLDPNWSQQKRAWQLACKTCEAYTKGYFADSSSKGWHACIKLRDIVSRTLKLEIDLGDEKWPLSAEYEGTRTRASDMESNRLRSDQGDSDALDEGVDALRGASGVLLNALNGPRDSSMRETLLRDMPVVRNEIPASLDVDKEVAEAAFQAAFDTVSNLNGTHQPVSGPVSGQFSLSPTDILDSNLFWAIPLGQTSERDDWTEELGDLDWDEYDKMLSFIRG